MELKKKLSAKTIVGKVKALLPKDDKGNIVEGVAVPLMRVYGQCESVKTGVSTFGEWLAFEGAFKAIRLSDGEVFAGKQLFLPEVVNAILVPVVKEANGATVEFAFDISAHGTATEVGYEYLVKPLMKVEESEPMKALEARLNLLALPSPAADTPPAAPDAAPAVTPAKSAAKKK